MPKTLTIRVEATLHQALKERAAIQGKSISEVARGILNDALVGRPLSERIGHLRGQLDLEESASDPWRELL
ncbi:MAG: hypothetical protein ACJ76J_30800, partial [Thermoanaerobaculia bacterium]